VDLPTVFRHVDWNHWFSFEVDLPTSFRNVDLYHGVALTGRPFHTNRPLETNRRFETIIGATCVQGALETENAHMLADETFPVLLRETMSALSRDWSPPALFSPSRGPTFLKLQC